MNNRTTRQYEEENVKAKTTLISINQEKQQQINRTLVLNLLRKKRLCSRADLARLSGLKGATITNIINEFIQADIVVEEGILTGAKGRRSIGIRINGEKHKVLGIVLARRSYSISILGLDNQLYKVKKFEFSKLTVEVMLEEVKKNAKKMIEEETQGVLAIGVTVPGPYKKKNGKLIFMTNSTRFENVDVLGELQKDFDIPVFIENDANAGAVAQQWKHNEEKEYSEENLVYVVAGEGIGCGIISKGELLRGDTNTAGEMGHCSIKFDGPLCECGNHGCLELYCSMSVLNKNIRDRIENGELTKLNRDFSYEELKEAIQSGDKLAVEEYCKIGEFLAVGIVNVINQINPSSIIIGDMLAELDGEIFLCTIRKIVQQRIRESIWENLNLEISAIEENAILVGSGMIAVDRICESPFTFIKK